MQMQLDEMQSRLRRMETRLAKFMIHCNVNPYYSDSEELEESEPMIIVDQTFRRVDLNNVDISFFEIKRKLFEAGIQDGSFELYCNGRCVGSVYL
jgi:hypothetical protein